MSTSPIAFRQPRAAYIHVPFCGHRCGYCNFTVVAGRDDLVESYLTAVELELSGLGQPRPVDTVFIGGGTPTHLPPHQLTRLLDLVRAWFPTAPEYEWTVEANPVDINARTLSVLVDAGVTRLSLGAQSFDDNKLRVLQRDHRANQIHHALRLARPAFQSLSIDLMFAVPGETPGVWEADLRAALAAPIDHVSCYGLTIEKGTQFYGRRIRGELQSLGEETDRDLYEHAIDRLAAAGFEHYEVSNFARRGHVCRHNVVYWIGRPYYAVGPGAARYVDGRREVNHRSTSTYLKRVLSGRSPVAESERLSPDESARERLVFGLRMMRGVDRPTFRRETGLAIDALAADVIKRFVRLGLLIDDGHTIRLTRRGLLVSDSMWPHFLDAKR